MRLIFTTIVLFGLSGCATAPESDPGARLVSAILGVFSSEPEQFRDNAEREQLALVAPQVSFDPDDPQLREEQARKRVYYRSFEPLYPGLDYATDAADQ